MQFQQAMLLTLLALPIFVIAQNPAIGHISSEFITAAPHLSPGITTTAEQAIYVSGMAGQFNDKADVLEEYETKLRQVYEKVGMTLNAEGVTHQTVVRQRVLIVGISQEYAAVTRKIMREFYGDARPASTATGTSGLFSAKLVGGIDVTAVLVN
jgi:enamine deaminase RidA (YjgF/YER057c/UK114 family)